MIISNKIKSLIILVFIFCYSNIKSQTDFYDLNTINTIEIFFPQSNWDQLMNQHAAIGNGDRLLADSIIINNITLDSVGIRYKGNSSFNSNNAKNPLNIKLDYIKNQDYQGYYTLKLSNGDKDPTFIRETLSYFITRHYMKAPKANYSNVYINGNYIGLYGNIESINKKFVKEQFYSDRNNPLFKCNPQNLGGGSGTIGCNPGIGSSLEYLGADTLCYEDYYELQSDFGWENLKDLTYLLNQTPNNLDQVIDLDRAIWFLALNNLLVNLDSYIGPFCQNYYLFKDTNNRFIPIAWDFNESFGHFSMINTPGPGSPPSSIQDLQEMDPFLREGDLTRPLCNIIYADPTYRKMYVAHMKTIITEFFNNNYYYQKADSIHNIINTSFQNDINTFYTWSEATQNITSSVGGKVGITELMDARKSYILSKNEFQYSAPIINNIISSVSNPNPYTTINITANISTPSSSVQNAYIGYRHNPSEIFTKVIMLDDGAHGDGLAGDGVFGATITLQASDVSYYIYAQNSEAGTFSPKRAEHEFYTIPVTGDIVINELMSQNNNSVPDQDGEYDDWIELYNNTNTDINLSGFYLSDNSNKLKWELPDTLIAANGYLVVWADENGSEDGLHANFKLSGSGEQITLYDSINNLMIDKIVFGSINPNVAFARIPNGNGTFIHQNETFASNNENATGIVTVNNNDELSIYPNPARNLLHIKTLDNLPTHLAIYDLMGKVLLYESYRSNTIDISFLKKGIYIIEINNTILKFIKQ